MRSNRFTPRLVATVVVTAGLLGAGFAASRPAPQLGATPVIVELFTSQGCSSCPPADALIRTIARDPSIRGRVIPLAFHVDYWNHLGWRDPFSSRAWSARQAAYVRTLRLASAYTPQAVINGSKQLVGSDERALWTAIGEESRRPASTLAVTWSDPAHATVTVEGKNRGEVMVAVFENDVSTPVRQGENGGRTLVNDAIVRSLQRAGTTDAAGNFRQTVALTLDPAWKKGGLGLAAFLQDPESLAIRGAAVAPAR